MEQFPDTTTYPVFDQNYLDFIISLQVLLGNAFIVQAVTMSLALILLQLVLATLRAQARPR